MTGPHRAIYFPLWLINPMRGSGVAALLQPGVQSSVELLLECYQLRSDVLRYVTARGLRRD